ncbi:caax amino protease family domain protein [Mycobacterium ulcerans str. Harvey]|uniref:Caax amino protease family domain protein n=1 Tax=Mycobacterium ulcerans str. Harvey TaxID=1299332 RepID=A0ABP3ABQ4_MYCUL|nr:caax amino protease family domain protein [Mycobacterium ulcerans str. Harvey]
MTQLSALHRLRIHLDVAVVVVVLVLTKSYCASYCALHHAVGEHRDRPGGRGRAGHPGA